MLMIQLVLVLFALFALTRVVVRFRKKEMGSGGLLGWSLLWVAVIVVVLTPMVAQRFAGLLGVGRGADAVIYVTLAMICYLLFRMQLHIRKLEREITELVRQLALEKAQSQSGPSASAP